MVAMNTIIILNKGVCDLVDEVSGNCDIPREDITIANNKNVIILNKYKTQLELIVIVITMLLLACIMMYIIMMY